jgi:protein involved in polysaccharide export with SLBB domain
LRVTVLGAVNSPGRYPYVPDRGWRYYVDLAGGFSEDLNDFGTVRIRDRDDREVDTDASVGPEYTIVARRDSPRYWLLRSLNVATTTMNFTNALLNLLETFGLADPATVFGSE